MFFGGVFMSILKQQNLFINKTYLAVSILGKSYKLNIKYTSNPSIDLIQGEHEIELFLPKKYKNNKSIDIINIAIKKLYDKIALSEIEDSMELARHIFKFAPEDYKLERLDDVFYKTLKNKIIINPDIVQYNKEIINTTIFQAFCKLKYKVNSSNYKTALENAFNEYEKYKKFNFSKRNLIKMVS